MPKVVWKGREGREGLQECAPAVPVAKPILRWRDRAALQPDAVLRSWCRAVCEPGSDWVVGWEESVSVCSECAGLDGLRFAKSHIIRINGRNPINSSYAGTTYHLSGKLGEKYPHGVLFNMFGLPDFSHYSVKNVNIGKPVGDYQDFKKANILAFEKIILSMQRLLQGLYGIMIQEGCRGYLLKIYISLWNIQVVQLNIKHGREKEDVKESVK